MKKVTLATLKSFINKNRANLFIDRISDFDSMQDCVTSTSNRGFYPIKEDTHSPNHSLGIEGLWLVGQSRDYIQMFEDDNYKWFNVYNSCGECNIAIKK